MRTHFASLCLAALASLGAIAMPATAMAGNVGYYSSCYAANSAKAPLITQAGHSPVAVSTLSSAELATLDALVLENCNGYSLATQVNDDVAAAVANGMTLVVFDWEPGSTTAAALPGSPAALFTRNLGDNIDLATDSPIATGPGGTLTDTSMDGGFFSYHGYATVIPAGSIPLITTADPSRFVGFAYSHGAGQVIWSGIPFDCYLSDCQYLPATPGIQAYFVNLLAWGVVDRDSGPGATTTCASEGYTATQLAWCQNICESELSGNALTTWIRRWTDRFRQLPYCMREEGGDLH